MVKRWLDRLGVEETIKLCKANNQIPPVTLRTNTLKVAREDLHRSLTPFAREIDPTGFAPEGLALMGLKRPVGDMPSFREGLFQVQDEAAQLVGHFLDPRPDETILDACAGLGGKTGHTGQLMNNSGVIRAMDQHAGKLGSLKASMERLGISTVTTWHHDLTAPGPEDLEGAFDRILLDAPCSGLGVLRRNPDTKWNKQEADLARLNDKQQGLLDALAPWVKRGGWLVYCVCSLEPEEGDRVVEDFLKRHPEFAICRSSSRLAQMDKHFVDKSGIFRTVPQKHGMDGFFAVRLQRGGP
jgi:16S rRNA (cytosine967-C5)-methyltransferase